MSEARQEAGRIELAIATAVEYLRIMDAPADHKAVKRIASRILRALRP